MDLFTFCLSLGFLGLFLMGALGALSGHGAHAGHAHHGDAHGFHLHGHHEVGSHSAPSHGAPSHSAIQGHAAHHHGDAAHTSHSSAHAHGQAHHAPSAGAKILSYLSPRVAFAVLLGFGATGLLVAPYLAEWPRYGAALAGGIGLEKGIISPLFNGLMRFGSNPARTLESAVMEEAIAVTAFDEQGCGLVAIDLDGHEMRVLARLNNRDVGLRVRAGDKLIVDEVDAVRGQCRVSRLGSESIRRKTTKPA